MKPPILCFDTLDDRRELTVLLAKLPPRVRVAFVGWCCEQIQSPTRPTPSVRNWPTVRAAERGEMGADDRLTTTLYTDVLILSSQWGLDLTRAACELERWVRRPSGRRPSPPASPSSRPCAPGAASSRTPCTAGSSRRHRSR